MLLYLYQLSDRDTACSLSNIPVKDFYSWITYPSLFSNSSLILRS